MADAPGGHWIFRVQGYSTRGDLLLETVHATESSKDIEVAVWRTRMKRKDDHVGRVEVTVLRPQGRTEIIYEYPPSDG